MVKFGQTGILVTAPDADVQFHDAVKGGNQLPHLNMIEEANKACDILIWGKPSPVPFPARAAIAPWAKCTKIRKTRLF